jgi:hypothetical protein
VIKAGGRSTAGLHVACCCCCGDQQPPAVEAFCGCCAVIPLRAVIAMTATIVALLGMHHLCFDVGWLCIHGCFDVRVAVSCACLWLWVLVGSLQACSAAGVLTGEVLTRAAHKEMSVVDLTKARMPGLGAAWVALLPAVACVEHVITWVITACHVAVPACGPALSTHARQACGVWGTTTMNVLHARVHVRRESLGICCDVL